jgi:hypothetical protein
MSTKMMQSKGCNALLQRLCLIALFALAYLPLTHAQDAVALKARHAALRAQLAHNAFQRPLYLESRQTRSELQGDIYAVSELPFDVVGPALQGVNPWCDILILHLNVKGCRAATSQAGDTLKLHIGRKDQEVDDAYEFEFQYQTVTSRPDYLQAVLKAATGPLGTRDYRILIEVAALDAGHSFLHVSYSYDYGMSARLAMQGYLATSGRKKLGFSIVGRKSSGQPVYIGGMRGVVERNTMRYYLAIEAYLGSLATPAHKQLTKRLNDWYAAIENYPVQLHELERDEYLEMKRKEIARQGLPDRLAAKGKRTTS